MRHTSHMVLLAVTLAMTPSLAVAQEEEGGGGMPSWSVMSGRTVGAGSNAFVADVGWPGIEGRFLHGLSSKFDVGGRFSFLYGSLVGVHVLPALHFGGVLRAGLVRNGMVSLGLQFEPGIGFGFNDAGSFLIHFPFEVQVGLSPSRLVNLVFAARLAPTVVIHFEGYARFVMPIMFGPGAELFLSRDLAVTLNTRFGPGVDAAGGRAGVAFSFQATFGVGYRF